MFAFSVNSMVRGYHVYQEVWEVHIGKVLPCVREVGNRHDPYVIAVKKDELVVGHLPRKISCICSIFIRRGGKIYCTAADSRRYSADLEQGGMEIPCTLTFKTTDKHENEKAHKLINSTMKMVEEKSLGNNEGTPVLEVQAPEVKEEQNESESPWEFPSFCNESSAICNSQNIEKIDLTDVSHDLVTADDPTCKKTKLDFERVIMGEKLSDLDINAAQRILKQQFPNVNGLESTLYQIKERKLTENQVKNKIQIIHCLHKEHWIVATTVGCEANVVKVYDSAFHSIDYATEKVIVNLFQYTDTLPTIKLGRLQKQKGSNDCGVFAIACATAIAFGAQPEKQNLTQNMMRAHLVNCLSSESVFP